MLERQMVVRIAQHLVSGPGPIIAVAVAVAILALEGCGNNRRVAYAPHELKAAVASRVSSDQIREIVVPFQPTPEMVTRAFEYVDGATNDSVPTR